MEKEKYTCIRNAFLFLKFYMTNHFNLQIKNIIKMYNKLSKNIVCLLHLTRNLGDYPLVQAVYNMNRYATLINVQVYTCRRSRSQLD